jgi:hypothetical protein
LLLPQLLLVEWALLLLVLWELHPLESAQLLLLLLLKVVQQQEHLCAARLEQQLAPARSAVQLREWLLALLLLLALLQLLLLLLLSLLLLLPLHQATECQIQAYLLQLLPLHLALVLQRDRCKQQPLVHHCLARHCCWCCCLL